MKIFECEPFVSRLHCRLGSLSSTEEYSTSSAHCLWHRAKGNNAGWEALFDPIPGHSPAVHRVKVRVPLCAFSSLGSCALIHSNTFKPASHIDGIFFSLLFSIPLQSSLFLPRICINAKAHTHTHDRSTNGFSSLLLSTITISNLLTLFFFFYYSAHAPLLYK